MQALLWVLQRRIVRERGSVAHYYEGSAKEIVRVAARAPVRELVVAGIVIDMRIKGLEVGFKVCRSM